MRTAPASHIYGDCLAKDVVLRLSASYLLVSACGTSALRRIDLPEPRVEFGADVDMARESEIERVFEDCGHGAVPPDANAMGSRYSSMRAPIAGLRFTLKLAVARRWSI